MLHLDHNHELICDPKRVDRAGPLYKSGFAYQCGVGVLGCLKGGCYVDYSSLLVCNMHYVM